MRQTQAWMVKIESDLKIADIVYQVPEHGARMPFA